MRYVKSMVMLFGLCLASWLGGAETAIGPGMEPNGAIAPAIGVDIEPSSLAQAAISVGIEPNGMAAAISAGLDPAG